MNKFFTSAIERFDKLKGREFLINPISRLDAEIIIELGQILKKVGLTDVLAILRNYKESKDLEIQEQLLQWNTDHPSLSKLTSEKKDLEENQSSTQRLVFFQIGDIVVHELDLRGYRTFDKLDEESGEYEFGIILNPMPEGHKMTQVPIFADEEIIYNTEENRNVVLKNLSTYLKERNIDTLDLEKNE